MNYSFDIRLATKYGVEEAIMISNLQYWIMKNKANNTNYYDGRFWTFNSMKAFAELFPFWSEKQIRRILQSLINQKIIITGNYNKSSYDRTLWYAFADLELSIIPNGILESNEWDNGNAKKGEPIPNINTDINTNDSINTQNSKNENFDLEENKNDEIEEKKDIVLNEKRQTDYSEIKINSIEKLKQWFEYARKNDDIGFMNWMKEHEIYYETVKKNYEALVLYCESNGKRYKDYKAALKNFILKDFSNNKKREKYGEEY